MGISIFKLGVFGMASRWWRPAKGSAARLPPIERGREIGAGALRFERRRVGHFALAEIAVDQPSAMMALRRDAGG
jgi:hypothetical protein